MKSAFKSVFALCAAAVIAIALAATPADAKKRTKVVKKVTTSQTAKAGPAPRRNMTPGVGGNCAARGKEFNPMTRACWGE